MVAELVVLFDKKCETKNLKSGRNSGPYAAPKEPMTTLFGTQCTILFAGTEKTFTTKDTLIGLIFARLNFAISRIFTVFAKLKLAKTREIADSRN